MSEAAPCSQWIARSPVRNRIAAGRSTESLGVIKMSITIFGLAATKVVNSAGLLCDIVGVILLFKFGLPDEVRRMGQSYIALEASDAAEIAKADRYDRFARIGLAAIIVGFILQLVSNFL
jgi:hypothetical protein